MPLKKYQGCTTPELKPLGITGRTILQMGLSLLNLQAFVFIPHSFKVPSQKHAPAKRLQWALAASA